MKMNRRKFLITATGSLVLLPLINRFGMAAQQTDTLCYFSTRADLDGNYFCTGFDAIGKVRFDIPLPARGHGMAIHPRQAQMVVVARRPGRFMLVIDSDSGAVIHQLSTRDDRHFYGHAEFSPDGRWLFTPENDYENGAGVIGIRDTQEAYRQVGEISSHGIGPHEARLCADGRTLVIANGGIKTHPDIGRAKLNLDEMAPSLTYVDSESGRLLEKRPMPEPLHQNGIRHLAVTADDQICFVTQYEGDKGDHPPLVGMHRRGEEVRLLMAPADVQARMRNYCGSVCADVSGRWFAVSSPQGNIVTFWDAREHAYVGSSPVMDGCGTASGAAPGEFLLSSGAGEIFRISLPANHLESLHGLDNLQARWDNHMLASRSS